MGGSKEVPRLPLDFEMWHLQDVVPVSRAYARGVVGVKNSLQLDILRKVHYLRKGD